MKNNEMTIIIDDKREALPQPIKIMLKRMDYDVVSQTWYVEYTSSKPGNNKNITKTNNCLCPLKTSIRERA
jgi:hypothetical protein